MEPIIEFRDFGFKYRVQQEPSLFDIDLNVKRGEKILITGASGSGKSTLLNCINGMIPCSVSGDITGSLTVDGLTPSEEGIFGMSKKVGTVLQDTDSQFIGMTVAEDLAFALENDAVPQKEMFRKVDEIAELVRMTDFKKNSPRQLSGGQKQRVSLGGVMVDDVDILLFDEPLANLDPHTGKSTIALIDDLMKEKDLTVIIVEHRVEDALYRDVDRIICMKDGRIIADLPPDEMLCGNVFIDAGIREPLYIAAIKHALDSEGGGKIDPKDCPQHIETMDLEPYIPSVRKWFISCPDREQNTKGDTILDVQHVSFSYSKDREVLHDVSFSIKKGEMLCLVGKNGAGKSTLSNLICGMLKPSSGKILLDGEDISPLSVKEVGERVGLVMQSPNQMISKPMIMDEVGLGLTARGYDEDEVRKRSEEALRICGLYQMRNWPVSALSFGQKKRVTIASILVMDPKVLILDEPTAGQDFRHYREIMEFLRDLNEETGLTVILITHDMHLMLEYSDRALVLSDGELIADERSSMVLTDPDIVDRASLKKTSLYDLAVKAGIAEPYQLVERFIQCERELMEEKNDQDAQL